MTTIADVAASAGLVQLAPSSLPLPDHVQVVDAEGRPPADTAAPAGAMIVLDRLTRDIGAQPLDLVIGRIAHRLRPSLVVVVSAQPPPRNLSPAITTALAESGSGLLWTLPSATHESAVACASRLSGLLGSRPGGPVADPHPSLDVLDLLDGDLALAPLLERLAVAVSAGIAVCERGNLVAQAADAAVGDHVVRFALGSSGRDAEMVVRSTAPLPAPVSVTLTRLAGVVAMALRVHRIDRDAAEPARAQLALILGDDLQAREAAVRRSRRLQLFPRRRMVVAVVEPFAHTMGATGLRRLAAQLEPAANLLDPRCTTLVRDGSIVLLLDAAVDLDGLHRRFRRNAALPLSIGVSKSVIDVRSLPGAFREAARAATIGRRLGAANVVTRYEQLGMLRLLYQLPEHERRAFVAETLGPVAGKDADATESRRLLRAMHVSQGNLADAARRLFVHRNTLRQRLTKLESVIGPFVEDPDRQLALYAALELHRLDDDSSDAG